MRELFFFKRELLNAPAPADVPPDEWAAFLSQASSNMLEEGRPCFLDEDTAAPDEELNSFVSERLISPGRPSPRTWSTYASPISVFLRHLETNGVDWRCATAEHLNRFFYVRTSGKFQNVPAIENKSWNVGAYAVAHLFEWAKDEGIISSVPYDYRRNRSSYFGKSDEVPDIFSRGSGNLTRFIPIDHYKEIWRPQVLVERNSLRNIALMDLLTSTGLRITEALNLNRGDLPDSNDPRWRGRKTVSLQVIGKGDKTRVVKVPKHVLRAIMFYLDSDEYRPRDEPDENTPVFLSAYGTRWSVRAVELLFEKISKETGIKLVPHGCRHTFAVYQLSALIKRMALNLKEMREHGADAYRQLLLDPLRALQRLLGHSSILSTYIYLDCLEEAEELIEESLESWASWTS